jgi:hypothetical protein
MERPHLLCLLVIALLLSACGRPPAARAPDPAEAVGPPLEQIPGDFERADWVAEVRVLDVAADHGSGDDGGAGYVVCSVRASVARAFKSPGAVPPELRYRFTAEGRCGPFPGPDQRLVVFLRSDPETGQLWQLAEGAQLPATPEVVAQVLSVSP